MKKNTVKPDRSSSESPLAIIGIGCLFPQANDPSAYWANIREGIDAITDIPATHWRTEDYYAQDQKTPDHTYGQRGGFISPIPFNPMEFNIPPNILEAVDTSQLLGLVAAGHALKDAGYGPERDYDRSRASVILGVTGTLELVIPLGARLGHPIWRAALKEAGVDDVVAEDVVERIADSYVPWQENSFPGLLGNVVAGRISKQYDLGGTNCVVDAACASSFSALHLASMELATGKSDMVVTGGIDTFNDIFMYMCFSKTPALSPSGSAKPFDASADGTILGEGLGIVVIKRLADAERDGDNIYAVIRGIGSSSDGKGDAIYAPSAGGQKKALLNAYERAGVTPESIGMIEAHGTGTKVGDAVEVSALREVYGEAGSPWCSLGSVKSQIGHTKAAAGAAGLIKAALALHHKVLPPTIKVQKPQAEIISGQTPFYLAKTKRPWLQQGDAPRRAGVSAFGFGGSNFHVVLEEYQHTKEVIDWDGNTQILAFSGTDAKELETALAGVPVEGTWNEIRSAAASSRTVFSETASCRLALVIEQGSSNLTALVNNARSMLAKNPDSSWNTPDGAFFAHGAQSGKLGVLFPGQGSQYTGMLNDLACHFPQVLDTLAAANNGFDALADRQLSDLIYPISAFDVDTGERQETELRATEVAQPAIGATSLGALKVLEELFGLAPDAVAGHSYGELTALCAAGRFDEEALHALSRLRGRLMGQGSGDKGSMLAISASLTAIEEVLTEEKLDLVIANRNAPTQAVLSGASSEIERAVALFTARKLSCKQLPVAAAFHSSLVADAAEPFLAALQEIEVNAARIPVYANTTAAEYPVEPDQAKALLAGQLAQPVEFVAEIEAMYAAGVHTFLEVGPGARLTGLVKAILGTRNHVAVALDASAGKRSGIVDLARALAQLAVLGHGIKLTSWDEGYQPISSSGKKPAMTVPICGANYVKPKPKKPPVAHKPSAISGASAMRSVTMGAVPATSCAAATVTASPDSLSEALRATQQSMSLLQRMQEETAQLHRRFLEDQESAGRTFQTLLQHQQQLIQGTAGTLSFTAPAFAPAPTAIMQPAAITPPVVVTRQVPVVANNITETLLAVVSEKTGYPMEMLELDMGMDSDLGIDSIKRVEILSALQERLPGTPVIGPEHLGTLRTLGEIAAHLSAGAGAPLAAPSTVTSSANVTETLLTVVSEKTGYPVEMLELDMGMDSDLGIDSIKRVEILSALQERLPGAPVIGPEQLGTLRTLGDIAHYLAGAQNMEQPKAAASPVAQEEHEVQPAAIIPAITRSGVVAVPLDEAAAWDDVTVASNAEFWVADDGSTFTTELCAMLLTRGLTVRTIAADEAAETAPPKDISGLIIVAPAAGTDDLFLENAFLLLKNAAPALRQAATTGNALFITVSRLDGSFGCGTATTLFDPLSGGLAGLAKTAAREWPEVICKAIDQGGFSDPAAAAQAVADEIFRSGPTEVGLTPEGRITLALSELPAAAVATTRPILEGEVVVITGGGRGVTAASAIALTEAYQPLLVLLGRSPEPTTEPEWLAQLSEAARIKRALLEHAGGKLHPREIEQRYQAVLAGRELTATLARIAASGGQAVYRSVDIRDADAVSTLLAGIRREHGPIKGLVHGAGVLADRLIIDKSRDKFALVYSTKVAGLRSLLAATAEDDLSFIALFSSTTGRFGRTGQVDYAVANEVLNKLAQTAARRRPSCRAVSINWGPWDGGMVTPALKKVFSGEGIGLIDLTVGGEFLVREIADKDAPVEIVAIAGTAEMQVAAPVHTPAKPLTEALALALSVSDYPFLRSHVLDGKAVLPMAVIVEWLAHGALHGNPGFRFHGFNDLRICKGVVFEQNTSCTLRIMAGRSERRESFHMVPVELVSTGKDGRSILHAKAEIVLTSKIPAGIRSITEIPTSPYAPGNDALYNRERLFHGPDLHGIEHVDGYSAKGIVALVKGAPKPAKWIRQPLRSSWLTDPLVMDSAFQLMILWSFERFGSGSLPCFAGRYRQFQETFPKEGVQVVIRITAEREQSATADMEFLDRTTGKLVARLEGYECIIDPSLKKAFQRNQLPQTECSVLGAA